MLDFFGAQRDIKEKTIRVLHSLSFVEDPTRVFRAIRFEIRFGFHIGKHTMNLIKNAIKFTQEGFIELGNYIEKDWLVFYVKDSGRGISKDRFEAIFGRFVQTDQNLTRAYEGSGLGLSITKAHVKALGGEISVESEPGKGSTFMFSIPYTPVKEQSKTGD